MESFAFRLAFSVFVWIERRSAQASFWQWVVQQSDSHVKRKLKSPFALSVSVNQDTIHLLVTLLPIRNRQYALTTLDRAVEELETYLQKNNLELDDDSQSRIKLAVLLNFIEELFINSYYSYEEALSLMKQQNVDEIKFGSNSYSKGDSLDKEWWSLVENYRHLQIEIRQLHIPSGKEMRELIESVRRDKAEYQM